jgi:DNA-binding GntR family transcriptional regulator
LLSTELLSARGATPSKPPSKVARVYERLRGDIVGLRLAPGMRIDKAELCERLGVSRQPVSEALARLADERLVSVEPQKGTYVARLRMRDVVEAAFLREALEVAAVRRLAEAIDAETLDRLRLIVEYQAAALAAGDVEEFYLLDLRFHATLFERLAFRRVAEAVDSARAQTERMRRLMLRPNRTDKTIAEHRAIVEALSERDGEGAATAMRAHLGNVIADLRIFAAEQPELFEL